MPSQTARARTRHPARPARAAAPRHARRVSGPLRPVPVAAPAAGAVRRGTTGVFERLRALPEHRVVDGLLRGRAWIWLIGLLLGGIVAMQVSLLKLHAGISRAVTTAGTLERQNAQLEAEIGRLSSGERVRAAAQDNGLVTPRPGAVEYLRSRSRDGVLAARRMEPPSDEAAAIMANGGREPGVLAATSTTLAGTTTTDPAATPTTTDPAAAGTTAADPATTGATAPVAPAPGTTTDPAAAGTTTDPAATGAPAPDTGAAVAPGQG
jgi:hypothetical protein